MGTRELAPVVTLYRSTTSPQPNSECENSIYSNGGWLSILLSERCLSVLLIKAGSRANWLMMAHLFAYCLHILLYTVWIYYRGRLSLEFTIIAMLMLNHEISCLHLNKNENPIKIYYVCEECKDSYWANHINTAVYLITVLLVCNMYIHWFQLDSLKWVFILMLPEFQLRPAHTHAHFKGVHWYNVLI